MTPEKVNTIVDALNQACAAKYEILRTPKSKQSDKIRTAIRDYRDQETKETEGETFFLSLSMYKQVSGFIEVGDWIK